MKNTMKSLAKITVLVVFFFLSPKNAMAQTKFLGTWLTEDKLVKILIYEAKNGKYYGKIIDDKEKKNIGKMLLNGLSHKNGELNDGTLLDPDKNKSYDCKLIIVNDNTLKLKVFWGLVSHSEKWTKIN